MSKEKKEKGFAERLKLLLEKHKLSHVFEVEEGSAYDKKDLHLIGNRAQEVEKLFKYIKKSKTLEIIIKDFEDFSKRIMNAAASTSEGRQIIDEVKDLFVEYGGETLEASLKNTKTFSAAAQEKPKPAPKRESRPRNFEKELENLLVRHGRSEVFKEKKEDISEMQDILLDSKDWQELDKSRVYFDFILHAIWKPSLYDEATCALVDEFKTLVIDHIKESNIKNSSYAKSTIENCFLLGEINSVRTSLPHIQKIKEDTIKHIDESLKNAVQSGKPYSASKDPTNTSSIERYNAECHKSLLMEGLPLRKLLMSGNEKTIARLIDNLSQTEQTGSDKSQGTYNLNSEALTKALPLDMLLKLYEISEKVEERKGGKVNSFSDAMNRLCNFLQGIFIFDGGIQDIDIKSAMDEMQRISDQYSSKTTPSKETKTMSEEEKKVYGKLTEKIVSQAKDISTGKRR